MQIHTTVNHLLCPSKGFSWVRHTAITAFLLAGTNAMVIFVPTIRDIFGFIGMCLHTRYCNNILKSKRKDCDLNAKYLYSVRRFCCCHAHLHPAFSFLHQTGQERVHEVKAKDRGKMELDEMNSFGTLHLFVSLPRIGYGCSCSY